MMGFLDIVAAQKRFATPEGTVVKALDDVSLAVSANEFVTLLGPSGCGKTTLLRCISGFEDLDEGDIRIEGRSILGRPPHLRPVNTVFQNYALFPHRNVADNVGYALEVAGAPRAERARRVAETLELVGLAEHGRRRIGQLSGGQQQRVALARAIIGRPKILLLDEPLSALDKALRKRMQQELKALQHELGISFVFVTHDQEEALTMSDRIAVLKDGRILQTGTPEEIYFRPANEFVARFIGESNLVAARVERSNGAGTELTLRGGGRVTLHGERLAPREEVLLLFRPEGIEVADTGGEGRDGLLLAGRVAERFFVGTDHRLLVDVPSLGRISAFVRHAGYDEQVRLQPGSDLRLHVPSRAISVIRRQV